MRRVHTLPVAAIVVLVGLIQVSSVLGLQPAADDGIATAFEDHAVTITLSGSDPTNTDLTFGIVDGPSNGTLDSIQTPNCDADDVCTADVTYTPDPDFFGFDSFTFTTSNGAEFSSAGTIDITVAPVNDAPTFTKGANQVDPEDAGAQNVGGWATDRVEGPANESSQALDFIVTNDNIDLFSVQPAVAANGRLTYTPAANANGSAIVSVQIHDDGGTIDGGQDTSAAQTFSITVTPVNDAPAFTIGAGQTVNEDAGAQTAAGWAAAISAGAVNESNQVLNFTVTNDNNGLFSAQPAVAANGTLTYTPASNASGQATISVSLQDNGGTANGGSDVSAVKTADITVNAVNDVPSFTKGANQTVLEDAGAQTVPDWATNLSAGPANESGQVLSFIVTNENNALFSTQPAVAANGTLTYTLAANGNGSTTVTVAILDNGGTANSGVNTSATQTFTITVTPVNDAPTFTKGANQAVLEDPGAQTVTGWATTILAGPSNEAGQALNFLVTNDNNALFSTQPAVAANGTLTYTPASNANGSATVSVTLHDDGGIANNGDDTSDIQTFTVTVTAVNDAPSFSIGGDQTPVEDTSGVLIVAGWITGISPGPADEVSDGQTVSFTVTNNANALFTSQPTVAANGTLTYDLAPDAFGTAILSVTAHDSAGGTSLPQTADITITAVNDIPSFTKGGDQTDLEDPGAQSIAGWATSISAGPANESGQALDFIVTNNTNTALFATGPAISATGTLTYTLALNANGSATVSVAIHDNGGTANGGVNQSLAQTFTITVTPVNDVPSFTKGANDVVNEDSGARSVSGWATAISAGAANESAQVLDFVVSNDNNLLFSVQPSISAAGQLTYTSAAQANGSATVSVQIHDNGGGSDTSTIQTFTITVTAVNDIPSFTKGGDQTDLEDPGAQSIAGWATSISAGPANESGQALDFIVTNNTNTALFATGPAISATGTLTYTLALNANGSATVSVAIHDNGGTANGGVNQSLAQTFTITVTPVNDVPSFTKGANDVVNEDSGARSVSGWATAISAGAANESAQVLDFVVSNDNNLLFSVQPSISAAGQLTYTSAAQANGSATVSVQIHDNGGGSDTSTIQTFTITITAVNDIPSFTKGADESVAESASPPMFTRVAWATNLTVGPADEASQTMAFTLTTDKDSLFAVKPAIDPSGTLTYRPKANTSGTAHVTVTLKDNGGTANGGVDTSPSQQLTIDVQGTNNAPAASSDHPSMPEGAAATSINVLANDQDLDGDTMTIVQVKCGSTTSSTSCATAHGTAAIASGGTSVTFKPAALFDGSDTFQYTISDGNGGSSSATVFVTVTKDTTAPVAKAPSGAKSSSVSGAAKTVLVTITWPATTDAGSGIAKYELQQSTNGGTWTNVSLSSATARSVTRTLTFGTTYRFRVRATDGEGNVGSWVEGRAFTPLKVTRGTSG